MEIPAQRIEGLKALATIKKALATGTATQDIVAEANKEIELHPSLDRTLGVRYRSLARDSVTIACEVTWEHTQPVGLANGGLFASLGETAGSMAGFLAVDNSMQVMGTTNTTEFLRPAFPGDVIISSARAIHLGRTSQLWRIEHTNEKTGKLLAITSLRTAVRPIG
ncbi:PaaI family thioesterase [Corynebacterium sp. HMSC28B08]|uniref:PaaI family thioesterase n=1 Tax=Corynebacterium sp. HMSC28B08 TaxID=1581066 RepID=UPI0008A3A920|nr:PaaI family thioesterase [Corynebacterium sp. HMSC28B08]OFT90307.1 hypothetical protein HMPREF3098_03480 [Corynebacterium sp. HMSC28B08]